MMTPRSTQAEADRRLPDTAQGGDRYVGSALRIGVVDGDDLWVDSPREFLRVRGGDLRRVAQRAASAREDHPGVDVLVDIDVMIDDNAAGARAKMATGPVVPCADTLTYIGTPTGLAGLITDLHALGICDGAMLRPLLAHVTALIHGPVLQELETMSPHRLARHESRPA